MQDIFRLNNPGIFGFINDANKTLFLVTATNMLGSINRILDNNNLVTANADIKLLEIVTNRSELQLRYNYWFNIYSNLGYNILSKKPSPYKLRIEVLQDFRSPNTKEVLFYLSIVPRSYKSFVVGVFSTYGEVEGFMRGNYSNEQVYKIVTADNQLTKEFLKCKV